MERSQRVFQTHVDKSRRGAKNHSVLDVGHENTIMAGVRDLERHYCDRSFDMAKQSKKQRRKTNISQSRSTSSKRKGSNNPTSSHSNSSNLVSGRVSSGKARNSVVEKIKSNSRILHESLRFQNELQRQQELALLGKLDEALLRDMQDKSPRQKVAICGKVWQEIIRREEPVIASLLAKIKGVFEAQLKALQRELVQREKEAVFEQELEKERVERKTAEQKLEGLDAELKRQQQCIQKQDATIQEMKKQILAYRQEIIELSTGKRIGKARRELRGGMDSDNMKVPRLDLSKVKRDSEDEEEDKEGHNVTY